MKNNENIKVGISIGDLNGIGGEIILKMFEDSRVLEFCTPVVFASVKTFSFLKKHFKSGVDFNGINHTNSIVHGKLNVLNVWQENVSIEFGKENNKIGGVLFDFIVYLARKGQWNQFVKASDLDPECKKTSPNWLSQRKQNLDRKLLEYGFEGFMGKIENVSKKHTGLPFESFLLNLESEKIHLFEIVRVSSGVGEDYVELIKR